MSLPGATMPPHEALFIEKLERVPDTISVVLEEYSGIPNDRQSEHILKVRNSAFKARPYPCLGRFRFLELDLWKHPLYKSFVLPTLKKASQENQEYPIYLDVGTCLGQDIRKLVYDGVNPQRLYGSDIIPAFIDAGYELFRDEDKFPRNHFLCPADVFDRSDNNTLSMLDGKVTILHVTAVFHLFSGEQQDDVAKRCMELLRKEPGSRVLVLGSQVGNIDARDFTRPDGAKRFRHNEESWRLLWEKTCARDEFKGIVKELDVSAILKKRPAAPQEQLGQQEHIGSVEEGFRWMVWQVWIQF